jgi:TatA/E family protein of Tat protein translocase
MGDIGIPELLIIFLFILIFFGGKRIPEIAKNLGKGIREFRKATHGVQDELNDDAKKRDEKSTTSKTEVRS